MRLKKEQKRPLITYYGGKQKIANKIIPLIPKHTTYVEPFAGGAAILFMKPVVKDYYYREVINDIDDDIINFYLCYQELSDELISKISNTLYSHSEWKKSKEILQNKENYNSIDQAWAYYINIIQGFGNKKNNGWGFCITGGNQVDIYNRKLEMLKSYVDRIKNIYIESVDAIKCIEKWDSAQTFFYIDPPYIDTHQSYYKNYTKEKYMLLINTLKEIKGSFILSHYDNEIIIPDGWEVYKFNTTMTINTNNKEYEKDRVEVLYRKITKEKVLPQIQKVYDSGIYDCFEGNMKRKKLF